MSRWDYWQRQEDEPLFPDIEWSKPETKRRKGRLLIVGGHAQGFGLPAGAFELTKAADAGEIQILLPDVLQKLLVDPKLPVVFAASTPIGSFAKDDGQIAGYLGWADMTLLAGDFGRNSETSLFMEKIFRTDVPLTITKDAFYYANHFPEVVLKREHTVLVVSLSQLQELLKQSGYDQALTSNMNLVDVVEFLNVLTEKYPAAIVLFWQGSVIVADSGFISTTKYETTDDETWQLEIAARASVYAMQHPKELFEALTSSALFNETFEKE